MSAIAYHTVGENLKSDAQRMQRLCVESAKDAAIQDEFWQTVDFYAGAGLPEIEQRISDRYITEPTAGKIITVDGHEAGLAFAYPCEVQLPTGHEDIGRGANVSLWLLNQYRGDGLGKKVLRDIVDEALNLAADPSNEAWFSRIIWTGIANDNCPSKSICKTIGFKRLCTDVYDNDRAIYVIPQP